MKRTISIILAISLALPSLAETVTVSKAQSVASRFFGETTKSSSVRLVNAPTRSTAGAAAPYYIFTTGSDNFVIVSGDDLMRPILGYSFTNGFDTGSIPGGLAMLLEGYSRNISKLRSGKILPEEGVQEQWDNFCVPSAAYSGATVVKQLQTALWGQQEPFNNCCPMYNGYRCLTGCGATAMAIVMKYYNYPDCAYGTVAAYSTSTYGIEIPARVLGHRYDWDNMLLNYNNGSDSTQNNAVAVLMADVGHMLSSDYSPSWTAVWSNKMFDALKYIKYNDKAVHRYRMAYSTADWIALLKKDIDAGHPVIQRGTSTVQGGHYYVVDGYDSEDFFHFNWGWYGSSNGYFYISDTEFSNNEDGYFEFYPDRSWTKPTDYGALSFYQNNKCFKLWSDTPYIKTGESFKLKICVLSSGNARYSGEIDLRYRSVDGSETSFCKIAGVELDPGYYSTWTANVKFDNPISEGDCIVAYYKDGDNWVLMDDGRTTLELRYSIPKVVSVSYYKSEGKRYVDFTGKVGMTCTFDDGQQFEFSSQTLSLILEDSDLGVYQTVVLSNGVDSYTVSLKF